MAASTQRGRYCSGSGQRQQHQQHDACEHQLRELAACARAIGHGGLRRAAVDHERPAHRGGGIRRREPEDVGVLVDALAIAQREHARGRGALRDDHHEARGGDRDEREGFTDGHGRKRDRRQPAGDRSDDGNAVFGEVERGAGGDRSHHREQRNRQARGEAMADEDASRHQRGQRRGRDIEPRQAPQDLPGLHQRAMRLDRHTEHVAEHRDADLNADAGEKPDQHRAREEIGEKSELQHPRQKQKHRGQQRRHADQRHILLAQGRRHGGQRAREDGRGGGIGRHHEMAAANASSGNNTV